MADRALRCGLAAERSQKMLEYLLEAHCLDGRQRCLFLYGEIIYVFALDETQMAVLLLTVFRAPGKLLRVLRNKLVRRAVNLAHGHN
jgi:hypothetical protein